MRGTCVEIGELALSSPTMWVHSSASGLQTLAPLPAEPSLPAQSLIFVSSAEC